MPKSEWKGDKRGGRTETEHRFTAPCSSSLRFIFNQPPLSSPAETRRVTASAEEVSATRCSWSPTERCQRLFWFFVWPGTWMLFILSKIQHVFMWSKCCFATPDFQILRLCREVTLGRPTAQVVGHCSCFWSAMLSPWSREITGELRAHTGAAYYATLRN